MDPWTTPLGPEVYDKNVFKVPFLMIDSDKWLSGEPLHHYYLGQKNRIIVDRVYLFRSDSILIMIYKVLIFSMSPPALMTASMCRGIDSNSLVR